MNASRSLIMAAEHAEARWDGLATVSAIIGISAIITASIATSTVGSAAVLLAVTALSGLGGYSVAYKTISNLGGGGE